MPALTFKDLTYILAANNSYVAKMVLEDLPEELQDTVTTLVNNHNYNHPEGLTASIDAQFRPAEVRYAVYELMSLIPVSRAITPTTLSVMSYTYPAISLLIFPAGNAERFAEYLSAGAGWYMQHYPSGSPVPSSSLDDLSALIHGKSVTVPTVHEVMRYDLGADISW